MSRCEIGEKPKNTEFRLVCSEYRVVAARSPLLFGRALFLFHRSASHRREITGVRVLFLAARPTVRPQLVFSLSLSLSVHISLAAGPRFCWAVSVVCLGIVGFGRSASERQVPFCTAQPTLLSRALIVVVQRSAFNLCPRVLSSARSSFRSIEKHPRCGFLCARCVCSHLQFCPLNSIRDDKRRSRFSPDCAFFSPVCEERSNFLVFL